MSKKRLEEEYQNSLSYRFRQWMQGEKDPFIDTLEMKPQTLKKDDGGADDLPDWEETGERSGNGIDRKGWNMHRRAYPVVSIFICFCLAAVLIYAVSYLPPVGADSNPANNEVPERYITRGLEETGAVNIVTGMILNYRAFDTFGESTVLFAAVCCVMLLLMTEKRNGKESGAVLPERKTVRDSILGSIAKIVCPAIFLFGIYIILNGHLSPGGGFSGGAVIGAGLILYTSAFGFEKTEHFFTKKTYTCVCSAALSFYCLAKSYSFFTGANHMENIIPNGTPGALFSSGLILPLNICVGLVVSCTVYAFYALFQRGSV